MTHKLNEQIKHTFCKNCLNRKGCQLKYSGIYIHNDVPEICLVNKYFKRKGTKLIYESGING